MENHLQNENLWDHVSGDANQVLKGSQSSVSKLEEYQLKPGGKEIMVLL
jgi:hypothetical protein